jgi:hypothetical protein
LGPEKELELPTTFSDMNILERNRLCNIIFKNFEMEAAYNAIKEVSIIAELCLLNWIAIYRKTYPPKDQSPLLLKAGPAVRSEPTIQRSGCRRNGRPRHPEICYRPNYESVSLSTGYSSFGGPDQPGS